MKESCIEGLANHNDPESGAGGRKDTGEATTVGTDRRSIELRKFIFQGADVFTLCGRQHGHAR